MLPHMMPVGGMFPAVPGYTRHGRFLPVVKLRGLPYRCEEVDIYDFFQGLEVVDILFVRKEKRLVGEAFVLFANQYNADLALQRNKMYMGRRYVEVFRVKKPDFYNAVANEVAEDGGIWQEEQKGPSFAAARPSPARAASAAQALAPTAAGGAAAATLLSTPLAAGVADEHFLPPLASPQIPGDAATVAGIAAAVEAGAAGFLEPPRLAAIPVGPAVVVPAQGTQHTGVLRLRGLPYTATIQDIMEFFAGFPLSEESIHIVANAGGRSTGEAFVEFPSPEDARHAMLRDRGLIGARYIELYASSREEATTVAARASTSQ